MGITAFSPDTDLFEQLLIQNQVGHGALGRFRGSEYQNGSGLGSFLRGLMSRVSRFTAPLVRSAMPHVKMALENAKPHLSEAAQSALKEAGRGISSKILQVVSDKSESQSGSGRRRITKKSRRKIGRSSVTKLRRIPPFDIPDSF